MRIDKFVGINNTEPLRSIADNALADAVNVDVTNDGTLIARNGVVKSSTIVDATSAWSTHSGNTYVVADGVLSKVNEDLTLNNLSLSAANRFCDQGHLFFANDGLMVNGGSLIDLKWVRPPDDAPILATTTGDLLPGTYHAYMTVSNAPTGLESGTSPIASITLTETGGISATVPTGYTHATIYVSNPTSTAYYSASGAQLMPFYVGANGYPDNVELVEIFNSSLWCSVYLSAQEKTVLVWSQPKYWHLFDIDKLFVVIEGHVRDMCRTNAGLVVGTDEAIYLINDQGNGYQLTMLANYGVVVGRSMVRTPENDALVYSKRGICSVSGQGFQNLTEKKVSLPVGASCSCAFVYQNAVHKFVALNDGAGNPFNAAKDTLVTTTTGAATVMNANNTAVTRYTSYNYIDIVKINNSHYGLKSDGLYLLEGSNDNGSGLAPYVITKETDFGTMQAKRVVYVYLNSDDAITVVPFVDKVQKTGNTTAFGGRRCKLGRGNEGRLWRFKLTGIKKLEGLEINPVLMQRKVK